MPTPSEIREKLAARQALEEDQQPGALDDILAGIGAGATAVAEDPIGTAASFGSELLSQSNVTSTLGAGEGAMIGRTLGTPGGPMGMGIGTVGGAVLGGAYGAFSGSLLESGKEGRGVGESLDIAIKEGGVAGGSEFLFGKLGKLWRHGKSKVLRGSKVGESPKGGLFGRALDDALDAHAFGKIMADEIEVAVRRGRLDLSETGLTQADLDRLKQGYLTPAQLTEGEFLDQLEGILAGSFQKGGMRNFKNARERMLRAYADAYKNAVGDLVERPEQLATILKKSMDDSFARPEKILGGMHERVVRTAGGEPTDVTSFLTNMSDELDGWRRIEKLSPDPDGAGLVLSRTEKLVKDAMKSAKDGKPQLTFAQMKKLRTDYRQARDTFSKKDTLNPDAARVSKKVEHAMTAAMEDTLKKFDKANGLKGKDSMLRTWRAGRKGSRKLAEEKDRLGWSALIDLIDNKKHGADALSKIMPANMSVRNMRLLRKRLGGESSDAWRSLQRWRVEQLLNKHITTKKMNFAGLLDDLDLIRSNQGNAGLHEMLGKDNASRLRRFANAGEVAHRAPPTGPKFAIHLLEAGAYLTPITTLGASTPFGPAGTAGVFVSTRQLAKWLISPNTAEMVLTGLNPAKSKTAAGIRAISGLTLRAMAEAGIEDTPANAPIGDRDVTVMPRTMRREDYGALFKAAR